MSGDNARLLLSASCFIQPHDEDEGMYRRSIGGDYRSVTPYSETLEAELGGNGRELWQVGNPEVLILLFFLALRV